MYILEVLCALAVAFLCVNVEAQVTKVVKISGEVVKKHEMKIIRFDCGGSICQFPSEISFTKKNGQSRLEVVAKGKVLCSMTTNSDFNYNWRCPTKKFNGDTSFFLYVYPDNQFTVAEITLKLGNSQVTTTELEAEGASIRVDPNTKKNYVRMKSGYKKQTKPHRVTQYRIECNGNCKDLRLSRDSVEDGDAVLVASKSDPVFVKGYGCYNCFCNSLKHENSKLVNTGACRDNNGNEKFDVDTSMIFITMIPFKSMTNAKAKLTGENIRYIKKYNTDPRWDNYLFMDRWNAPEILVKPIEGPLADGTYVHLKVFGTESDKDITIDIISDVGVKVLRAGNNTQTDANGVCKECFCNGEADCKKTSNPSLICDPNKPWICFFYVTLQMNNHPSSKNNGEDFIWFVKIAAGKWNRNGKIVDAHYPYDKKDSYP